MIVTAKRFEIFNFFEIKSVVGWKMYARTIDAINGDNRYRKRIAIMTSNVANTSAITNFVVLDQREGLSGSVMFSSIQTKQVLILCTCFSSSCFYGHLPGPILFIIFPNHGHQRLKLSTMINGTTQNNIKRIATTINTTAHLGNFFLGALIGCCSGKTPAVGSKGGRV